MTETLLVRHNIEWADCVERHVYGRPQLNLPPDQAPSNRIHSSQIPQKEIFRSIQYQAQSFRSKVYFMQQRAAAHCDLRTQERIIEQCRYRPA
jgi:hypothetical protein